jgi:hypothetical protein
LLWTLLDLLLKRLSRLASAEPEILSIIVSSFNNLLAFLGKSYLLESNNESLLSEGVGTLN